MTILDDILSTEEATLAKLASITNAHAAVQAALDAQTKKIAQLTSDLLAAVNAGNNAAQLQAVLDKANAILNSTDNAAVAAAALANTGAGEAPAAQESADDTPVSDTTEPPSEVPAEPSVEVPAEEPAATVEPAEEEPVDTDPAPSRSRRK